MQFDSDPSAASLFLVTFVTTKTDKQALHKR